MRLLGRRALVTGASTGIGRAVALRFAQEGAEVAIHYHATRDAAEASLGAVRAASASAGRPEARHIAIEADIGDEQAARAMVEHVTAAWDGLDILINNAGIQIEMESANHPLRDVRRVIDVNLLGALVCSQAAIRHWRSRHAAGVIVNCSSVHEIIPKPGFIGYALSKGGLGNLTRTLALEYAAHRIRVNGVAPGAILTPMNQTLMDDAVLRVEMDSRIPMHRMGAPEEMAAVFAFLASDDASYVTGQTLYACGGLTLSGGGVHDDR